MQNKVQVAAATQDWQPGEFSKSTFSNEDANCVGVAVRTVSVGIRDTKEPFAVSSIVEVAPQQWASFVQGVTRGQLA